MNDARRNTAEWYEQFTNEPEMQIADSILVDYGRDEPDSALFLERRQMVANRVMAFARKYASWKAGAPAQTGGETIQGKHNHPPGVDVTCAACHAEGKWELLPNVVDRILAYFANSSVASCSTAGVDARAAVVEILKK